MNPEATSTGTATYSPEDNKLRLYIGRVPRPEYEKLRAEGWKALYKQREAGGGDFVAVWTPERRDTAIAYGDGAILDEDMGPAERAADRAERFGGYRDKRTDEAGGHADRYDAGPAAHGFQNQARAERAAARHDRIADRAGDQWSKAEYWTRRTAGVISHALHVSSPGVRMGRIKELEAAIRKAENEFEDRARNWRNWVKLAAIADTVSQTAQVLRYVGSINSWSEYMHPRAATHPKEYRRTNPTSLYSLCSDEDPITGAEACALFFSNHREPKIENDEWLTHYRLRLAYENQMLEAQGGRAGEIEMIPGGWLRGGRRLGGEERQIQKVNKSPATGRIVSVLVRDNHASAVNHGGNPFPDGIAQVLSHTVEIERMAPDAYRAPTAEELAAFEAAKKERKAAAPKKAECPLVNPTDADAERLLALWNERGQAKHKARREYGDYKPATIERVTQAVYSANSRGTYAKAETRALCALGELQDKNGSHEYRAKDRRIGPALCCIRIAGFQPRRIIILTDKPQKPLQAAVWVPNPTLPTVEGMRAKLPQLQAIMGKHHGQTAEEIAILTDAAVLGWVTDGFLCNVHWTDAGIAEVRAMTEKQNAEPAFALEMA